LFRAQRRAFIRDHHPDRGGDPDAFIEGLRHLAGPDRPARSVDSQRSAQHQPRRPPVAQPDSPPPASPNDPVAPVFAYRSRRKSPTRLLRRVRAKLAGTPQRRLK